MFQFSFVVRLLWFYETCIVITEYYVIYLTIAQTIGTYNDLKKFLYSQTAFQHVSMMNSTIIRAFPPARTKTLLLQTFYHILHTQIHSVSPTAQMHSTPESAGHLGNPESRSWLMHDSWCVSCVFCLCYAYHIWTLCLTKTKWPEMLYILLQEWCDVQLPS